jgi:hypothetical protein
MTSVVQASRKDLGRPPIVPFPSSDILIATNYGTCDKVSQMQQRSCAISCRISYSQPQPISWKDMSVGKGCTDERNKTTKHGVALLLMYSIEDHTAA